MKIAIMQPYFLPYIGYFQLVRAVDEFVIYDNIKFTKKGWINRNRYLLNGNAATFTIPLKKDSDTLDIKDREVSEAFDRKKLLNKIAGAYRKAPQFNSVFPIVEAIVMYGEKNLFTYLKHSIETILDALGIETTLTVSSSIKVDHSLKAQTKVVALCERRGADTYVNPPGGTDIYSRDTFSAKGMRLYFLKPHLSPYTQFGANFVEGLSILDVMMFNSPAKISVMLDDYALV